MSKYKFGIFDVISFTAYDYYKELKGLAKKMFDDIHKLLSLVVSNV